MGKPAGDGSIYLKLWPAPGDEPAGALDLEIKTNDVAFFLYSVLSTGCLSVYAHLSRAHHTHHDTSSTNLTYSAQITSFDERDQ